MATTPTKLPVPSESPRDLKFNAGKVDEFVTSTAHAYTDRFGVQHWTIAGIKYTATQVILRLGYITMDSFQAGATLTLPNQVLRDTSTGEYYRWDGAFPKLVPAGSTPATSGGIGSGAWLSVGDATLRGELGADDGFDKVGRFLNIESLRSHLPSGIGMVVHVLSAASNTDSERHYGGGLFQSFDNSINPVLDDGGIVIAPATGNLAWRRINFSGYDMCFWGLKPDGITDNAVAITKATDYAKTHHVELLFPSGNVKSSEAFPFYSRMSMRGSGRESSFFSKTTNNKYFVSESVQVDALLVMLPDVYDPSGYTMDTFCFKPKIEGITFQRDAATADTMCYYSVWAGKLAAPIMRDLTFSGHYIGMYGTDWFLFEATSVQFLGIPGRTFMGISCTNIKMKDSRLAHCLSGTSLNWNLVSVVNAQIAFDISGQQYCSLSTCTAEGISPIPGETNAVAFHFVNPSSISLVSCATEVVTGEQIRIIMAYEPSYKGSVVIQNYIAVEQKNPANPTKYFVIDSANAGALSVTFLGGDLSREPKCSNIQIGSISGKDCVVSNVGCWMEQPLILSGAVYKEL